MDFSASKSELNLRQNEDEAEDLFDRCSCAAVCNTGPRRSVPPSFTSMTESSQSFRVSSPNACGASEAISTSEYQKEAGNREPLDSSVRSGIYYPGLGHWPLFLLYSPFPGDDISHSLGLSSTRFYLESQIQRLFGILTRVPNMHLQHHTLKVKAQVPTPT